MSPYTPISKDIGRKAIFCLDKGTARRSIVANQLKGNLSMSRAVILATIKVALPVLVGALGTIAFTLSPAHYATFCGGGL